MGEVISLVEYRKFTPSKALVAYWEYWGRKYGVDVEKLKKNYRKCVEAENN